MEVQFKVGSEIIRYEKTLEIITLFTTSLLYF